MHTYKTYNNIAKEGIDQLENYGFKENKSNPDALLMRSHELKDQDFNISLKCICRAGAGVNHIPIKMLRREVWLFLIHPVEMPTL